MYDKVLTMVCQRPTGQLKPKNKIYTFFIFDIQLRTLRMVWIARRCLARFRFANAMPAGPSADARAPAEGEGVRQKKWATILCVLVCSRALPKSHKNVFSEHARKIGPTKYNVGHGWVKSHALKIDIC